MDAIQNDSAEITPSYDSLEQTHDLLRALVASAQEGILVLDRSLRYRLWNECMVEMSGMPAGAVVGRPGTDVFPWLKELGLDRLWARALAGEAITSPDFPYRASTGRTGWCVSRYSPLRSPEGEIVGVIGIVHDITRRKAAEAQLQASEQKYRALVDNLNVGVFHSTLDGSFIHVNQALASMAGYDSPDEMMTVSVSQTYANPSDRQRLLGIMQREGRVQDVDVEGRRKDGSRRWGSMSAICLRDEQGNPNSLLGVITDISERKRVEQALRDSEERLVELNQSLEQRVEERTRDLQKAYDHLRDLSRQVPGMLYQLQMYPDGRMCVPYASEASRDLFGLDPDEFRQDASRLLDCVHPEDRHDLMASILESSRTLQPWHHEFRVHRPTRGIRWCAGGSSPQLQEDGSVLWHGFISDISERKQNEDALRDARDAAEASTRAKSQFLANMSHEIRTPLNAVMGFIELTLDTSLDDEQRQYLAYARDRSKDLLVLMNDILDLSRIEAGRLTLVREEFSPAGAVDEVLRMFAMTADRKGLRLAVETSIRLPRTAIGDPRRIRQVLVNLVGNAVKFTETGEVVVSLDRSPADEHGAEEMLYFRVRDTGIGIHPDDHELVFKPFAQADEAHHAKYGGAGLGLAIARRLVEIMGGRIWIESKPGHGSTLHFTVRVAGQPVPTATVSASTKAVGTKSIRILLVEDEKICGILVTNILQKQGHLVTQARDGHEALEVLGRTDFDLVLMDVQIPGIDGLETTRVIRDPLSAVSNHQVPVIALTAFAMDGDEARCLEAGMCGYLSKPVSPEAIAAAIAGVMAGHG